MPVNSKKEVKVNKIKSLMALHSESHKDISKILGIAASTLNQKLIGKRNFTLKDLFIMSEHYKVDLDYFIED